MLPKTFPCARAVRKNLLAFVFCTAPFARSVIRASVAINRDYLAITFESRILPDAVRTKSHRGILFTC